MAILIKILNESREGMSHRDMGGISGINYRFDWSTAHGSWVYEAKTQVEIDDIIQVNFLPKFPWRFSFIMPDGAAPGAPSSSEPGAEAYRPLPNIAPWVAPSRYASYPAIDLLDLARNCGFTPQGSHTDTLNLRMQLDAYMVGRAFALEESKRLRRENEDLVKRFEGKPEIAPAPALVVTGSSVTADIVSISENLNEVRGGDPDVRTETPLPAAPRAKSGRKPKAAPSPQVRKPRRLQLA